jgi:hypothetical protein
MPAQALPAHPLPGDDDASATRSGSERVAVILGWPKLRPQPRLISPMREANVNYHPTISTTSRPPPSTPSIPYISPTLRPSRQAFIMPATTAETLSLVTRNVSVAPLVLLSAADHYGRSAKGTRKRVVGVLLGQNDGKNVRVSNSFAGELLLIGCGGFPPATYGTMLITDGCPRVSSTLRRGREGPLSMVPGS